LAYLIKYVKYGAPKMMKVGAGTYLFYCLDWLTSKSKTKSWL